MIPGIAEIAEVIDSAIGWLETNEEPPQQLERSFIETLKSVE